MTDYEKEYGGADKHEDVFEPELSRIPRDTEPIPQDVMTTTDTAASSTQGHRISRNNVPPPQVLRMSSNNVSTAKGLSPIRVQGLRVSNASSPQGQGMTCNNATPLTEKPGIFQVQIPCPPNIHANVQDANRALIQSCSWITVPPLNHPVGSMQPSQTNPPSVRSFINDGELKMEMEKSVHNFLM